MNNSSEGAQFFRFVDGSLREISEPGVEVQLAAADSWLVDEGKVRNLDAHFERFARWALAIDPEAELQLANFFDAVTAALPRAGRWFPRIEFHAEAAAGQRLHFRLRTAPDFSSTVVLWLYPEPDTRRNPLIKGPDLSFGMQLRRNAKMHGADEAVLLTADGFINEGALSSLVWWRGDVLCSTSTDVAWLPSVTRDEVFGLARDCGNDVRLELATPESLAGLEVWVLSSLSGVRPATSMILGEQVIEFASPLRADSFQKRLRMLAAGLPN
jgi:branched-subunit amino acid aminotransferase/4-amino-4-deoxychorismate lyase